MEVGRRRGGGSGNTNNSSRNGVVAGSVWETRMKSDEVKGGIKVFNGEEVVCEQTGVQVHRKFKASQGGGKRKTWKSESSFDGFEKNSINPISPSVKGRSSVRSEGVDGVVRKSKSKSGFSDKVEGIERNSSELRKTKSDSNKVLGECGEGIEGNSGELRKAISDSNKVLGECGEGIEGNSGELRKAISDSNKVLGECVEGIESNLVELRSEKLDSLEKENSDELENVELDLSKDVVDVIENSPIELKKSKSDSNKVSNDSPVIEKSPSQLRKSKWDANMASDNLVKDLDESGGGIEKNPVQLRKSKWDLNKVSDNSAKDVDVVVDGIEKNPIQSKNSKWDANKVDSVRNLNKSVDGIEKSPAQSRRLKWDSNKVSDNSTNGIEKNPIQFTDFGVCKEKVISQIKCAPKPALPHEDGDEDKDDEEYEEMDEEIDIEIEKKRIEIKEINVAEEKPKKVLNDVKKIHQISEKRASIASNVVRKQISPIINHPIKTSIPTKPTPISVSYEFQRVPETHSRLQHLVDLVMWRDVSKSAFVFGIGTFFMLSSSYTNDLNVSFISVISYLGLVYLAAVFLYKSLICRRAIDLDVPSGDYMFGEEEAVWLLKLVLPYLNEFLLKIRGLFSGDPATTMKLAVLLFVLARCGSSITIWKMAKLGFFGVFTVPKVCSSYSSQLTDYGKFWIRRFRDAWGTCAHKKAVAAAIFTLVWNLSSIVARIWAVFVLFVAVRYYQESMIKDKWTVEEEPADGEESIFGSTYRRTKTA